MSDFLPNKARGANHPASKLEEKDVREIRRLHSEGAAIMGLSRHFGVSSTQIRAIVRRKSWAHVD